MQGLAPTGSKIRLLRRGKRPGIHLRKGLVRKRVAVVGVLHYFAAHVWSIQAAVNASRFSVGGCQNQAKVTRRIGSQAGKQPPSQRNTLRVANFQQEVGVAAQPST